MPDTATLFVGNLCNNADEKYIQRLFATYGTVEGVEKGTCESGPYALVTFTSHDDSDCAVAALHMRYCMAPGVPLVVLYAKTSQIITDYGRAVGAHYKRCVTSGDVPTPLALEAFDRSMERTSVAPPPTDFTLPRGGFPMAVRPY